MEVKEIMREMEIGCLEVLILLVGLAITCIFVVWDLLVLRNQIMHPHISSDTR